MDEKEIMEVEQTLDDFSIYKSEIDRLTKNISENISYVTSITQYYNDVSKAWVESNRYTLGFNVINSIPMVSASQKELVKWAVSDLVSLSEMVNAGLKISRGEVDEKAFKAMLISNIEDSVLPKLEEKGYISSKDISTEEITEVFTPLVDNLNNMIRKSYYS